MYSTWHRNEPDRLRRSDRSKNGCLTCRRRKVRCDQQQPRCGHCSRLRLSCTWRASESSSESQHLPSPDPTCVAPEGQTALPTPTSPNPRIANTRPEEVFEFAGFLWGEPDTPTFSDGSHNGGDIWANPMRSITQSRNEVTNGSLTRNTNAPDINHLTQYFQRSEAPPILSHIETQSRWNLMRDLLMSMASTSLMVHYAIAAFSSLQSQQDHGSTASNRDSYYTQSQEEISYCLLEHDGRIEIIGAQVQHVLAALFLLSYIDLVTNRTNLAHPKLRRAFVIVSNLEHDKLGAAEKILISWIRLLDARAVSAGGEGLFLQDETENQDPNSRSVSPTDNDVEAVVSDLLLKPSQRFFQKTQLFMGRITKIDLWHRDRGTVEDESEVMGIAAQISTDNHKLYQHRHPLLDLAVSGKLEAPLVGQGLADRVTRSSRMALANYHATFIHLHRVAYRHLPRTKDVCTAIAVIRRMTHDMVDAQQAAESLPVNMLWPLLMWGSEEEDTDERKWILSTIRQMSSTVSNAAITADVLEEVLRRQDEAHQRMDIRTVMHDIFNSCFAIV